MSFAGVSFLRRGGTTPRSDSAITAAAVSASGYHLLMVDGYSRTKDTPNGECIRSRPFRVGGCRWVIECYPNAKRPENADYISLFLLLDDETVTDTVEAKFDFSFIDEAEKQAPAYIRATETYSFLKQGRWGSLCFIKRDVLEQSKHLMDDCFTIRCDILVTKGPACTAPFILVPPSDMHQNFGDLL
ncbi:hypothetical protein QOZ80_7AG0568820 [Eleusine coracana subsp. coracana]|nr:hypothetical protein QOZ80_7AG0568820 [Eleusine coracana subsp. coracana]